MAAVRAHACRGAELSVRPTFAENGTGNAFHSITVSRHDSRALALARIGSIRHAHGTKK
ncbi:MAG: hypothetical protein LBT64_01650 [Puniceicoccales bacterium]|nr:hypothetical protein [Puniceicoccales bacterium]